MRPLIFLLWLSIALLGFGFGMLLGMDNSDPVRLVFLEWQSPAASVLVWIGLALVAGFLLGLLLGGAGGLRQRLARRAVERELKTSRREISDLRQLAIED